MHNLLFIEICYSIICFTTTRGDQLWSQEIFAHAKISPDFVKGWRKLIVDSSLFAFGWCLANRIAMSCALLVDGSSLFCVKFPGKTHCDDKCNPSIPHSTLSSKTTTVQQHLLCIPWEYLSVIILSKDIYFGQDLEQENERKVYPKWPKPTHFQWSNESIRERPQK